MGVVLESPGHSILLLLMAEDGFGGAIFDTGFPPINAGTIVCFAHAATVNKDVVGAPGYLAGR
jgi:hypothetical protein